MSDWSNWTVQERCVAELIIEIFEKKYPSGTTGFLPENICGDHYDHLKAMWVPKKVRVLIDKKWLFRYSTRS